MGAETGVTKMICGENVLADPVSVDADLGGVLADSGGVDADPGGVLADPGGVNADPAGCGTISGRDCPLMAECMEQFDWSRASGDRVLSASVEGC